ncbi:MAG TPA: hypothetical protein VGK19_20595 [Capsulimonadaceae bacterium]|jgi:hypothetical protein
MYATEDKRIIRDSTVLGIIGGGALALSCSIIFPLLPPSAWSYSPHDFRQLLEGYASIIAFIAIVVGMGLLLGGVFGFIEGRAFVYSIKEVGEVDSTDRKRRMEWRKDGAGLSVLLTIVATVAICFVPVLPLLFLVWGWRLLILVPAIPTLSYYLSDIVLLRHCRRTDEGKTTQ